MSEPVERPDDIVGHKTFRDNGAPVYRMIVIPSDGEAFVTCEMGIAMLARLAHYFRWAGSEVRSYRSWDGEIWRKLTFQFSPNLPPLPKAVRVNGEADARLARPRQPSRGRLMLTGWTM